MQKILVARSIFPDVIDRLKQYFDVDWNEGDVLPADELKRRLADKDGALTAGDMIDTGVLAAAPRLRVVSNMAVGYNNFDMQALNAHLNFSRLGVVVEEYEVNVYGASSSPLHRTPTQ